MKATYWWHKLEPIRPRKGDAQIWGQAFKTVYYRVTKKEYERLQRAI